MCIEYVRLRKAVIQEDGRNVRSASRFAVHMGNGDWEIECATHHCRVTLAMTGSPFV
ncbi:MAG: hypothetical protein SPI18_02555 [Prevotella sp.]|nr:hypothetical protein [Prevotella sp.]